MLFSYKDPADVYKKSMFFINVLMILINIQYSTGFPSMIIQDVKGKEYWRDASESRTDPVPRDLSDMK